MKNTNQLWKYTWNPQGYFETEIKIDLTKKYKNNTFTLNHTFFKSKDCKLYTYTSSGNKKFYNCHEELKDNTDFLFSNKDDDLSKLCGSSIYSRIKLISTRVIDLTEVYCDCYFVADAIDPSTFNQDLHQEAEVKHKSLNLTDYLIVPKATINELISNKLSGDWGNINKDNVTIKTGININGVYISDTGLLYETSDKNISFGEENYKIEFDKKVKNAFISVGNKRTGLLFRGPKTLEEVPVFGIPVILGDDKTRWSFVPWFTLDAQNKGIKLGSININDKVIIKDNEVILGKDSDSFVIKLDTYNFITYNKALNEVSVLDGAIKINVITKQVSFNNITLDQNFMNTITQMQRDIQDLKRRIK